MIETELDALRWIAWSTFMCFLTLQAIFWILFLKHIK